MDNFKKVFAIILALVTLGFGIFALINDQPIVGLDSLKALKFDNDLNTSTSILVILYLVVDILLLAMPVLGILLIAFEKVGPYGGIESCTMSVLWYFIIRIFAFVLFMAFCKAPAEVWKSYLFDKEYLGIIPILVFFLAIVLLSISAIGGLEGTVVRAILATIASALAIFGIIFYFVCGNGTSILLPTMDKTDVATIIAITTGAVLYVGLMVYTYLPQTREFDA